MTVGLPTSTPAFQMAAMYGVRPDIPGFHYYDRETRTDVHFPRPGHAARVEATQAAGRRGILKSGSAYGCVFTGGADNDLYSFAGSRGQRVPGCSARCRRSSCWAGSSSRIWCGRSSSWPGPRRASSPTRAPRDPTGAGWTIKIGLSVWVRGLFTLAVSRDLYAGIPAIYVNYLDYDVAAHAFGPRSRRALRSLRRVDRAIRQLARVVRRVPEHEYDLYIVSDHGQVACTPYRDLSGGRRLERQIFDEFLDTQRVGTSEAWPRFRAHCRDPRPPGGDTRAPPALPQLSRRRLSAAEATRRPTSRTASV